jgi:hypothetical protein
MNGPVVSDMFSIHNPNSNTVELIRTELWTLPPLLLGGIIENQNSDFVMQ